MLGMLRMRVAHAGVLIIALFFYVQLQATAIDPTSQPLNHTSGQDANVTTGSMVTGLSNSSSANSTVKPSGAAPFLRSGALSLLFPVAMAASALRARC